jgi:LIVCS family branched-chain amino acid:cation transporter
MGVAPFFDSPALLTSLVYFSLVFLLVLNRSRIVPLIGKWLTPAILIVLLVLIGSITLGGEGVFTPTQLDSPFSAGLLEGYQTFDAIGAVVVGGVILISLKREMPDLDTGQRFHYISRAGWIAGLGLLFLYAGLILSGAFMGDILNEGLSRTEVLREMSALALGYNGNVFLSLLIALACFTTAVGIVTGTSDFVQSRFGDSKFVYRVTALGCCVLGVLMGQFPVDYIIAVALPALMFIYPLTIVLILLNALPPKWTTPRVFNAVVFTTLFFTIPDFLGSIGWPQLSQALESWWPLQSYQLGWVLPAVAAFFLFRATEKPPLNTTAV